MYRSVCYGCYLQNIHAVHCNNTHCSLTLFCMIKVFMSCCHSVITFLHQLTHIHSLFFCFESASHFFHQLMLLNALLQVLGLGVSMATSVIFNQVVMFIKHRLNNTSKAFGANHQKMHLQESIFRLQFHHSRPIALCNCSWILPAQEFSFPKSFAFTFPLSWTSCFSSGLRKYTYCTIRLKLQLPVE